jgi:hypothetical protein
MDYDETVDEALMLGLDPEEHIRGILQAARASKANHLLFMAAMREEGVFGNKDDEEFERLLQEAYEMARGLSDETDRIVEAVRNQEPS